MVTTLLIVMTVAMPFAGLSVNKVSDSASAVDETIIQIVDSEEGTQVDDDYPTNANGSTYGSALAASSLAERPDLIRVVLEDGREGYVYRAELDAADPQAANPEEAGVIQENEDGMRAEVFVDYLNERLGLGITDSGTERLTGYRKLLADFSPVSPEDSSHVESLMQAL